ncbi:MAG: hypothetical protein KatS3mg023_3910 [Armatimonadota bacterium]|nr:MAG: hypothetical protein KatS3mg023_3910 [Armatimonadota bacterium]
MYYALRLKYEADRRAVGSDVLVLNVDPPHVYAVVHGKPRLVVRFGEKAQPILQFPWDEGRVGELVLLALAKLRSDPTYADAAAQLYAETTHRCARCHRRITDSRSVKAGLGPECQKKGGRIL